MKDVFLKIYYIVMIVQFVGKLIRKNIRKHSSCFSRSIQNIIKKLINLLNDKKLKKSYKIREKEFEDWLQKKSISQPEKGQMVDVRDTEDIWCIGTIKDIFINDDHSKTLLIHYKGRFIRLESCI